jgi:hypothetical protein
MRVLIVTVLLLLFFLAVLLSPTINSIIIGRCSI